MATRNLGSLTIDLLLATAAFEFGMSKAERIASRETQKIDRHMKRMKAAINAAMMIAAPKIFGDLVSQTVAAQNAQTQLAAVLKSTGEAAGYGAEQLNRLSASFATASTFSTNEITDAQTTLLAFTGIVGKQFPQALQAAVDMAARTGMSVKSAAETIGRALDVPSQGLSALTRQGFRFTAEQKRLVEQLEATGRTAEAQEVILAELTESYGGAAKAARDTLGGALAALRNSASDLFVAAGTDADRLRSLIESLNRALGSDTARKGMNALITGAQMLTMVLIARVAVGATRSTVGFAKLALTAGRTQYALATTGVVSQTAAIRIGALAVATRTASASMALLGGPVGLISLALGAAGFAWMKYGRDARDSASESVRAVADIKGSVQDLIAEYQKLNVLQRQQVLNVKTDDLNQAIKARKHALEGMIIAFSPSMAGGMMEAAGFQEQFRQAIHAAVVDVGQNEEELARNINAIIDAHLGNTRAGERNRAALVKYGQEVVAATSKVRALRGELSELNLLQLDGEVSAAPDPLAKQRENLNKFMRDFATPQEKLKAAIAEHKALLGELYSPEVERRIRERYLPKSGSAAKQASELSSTIKQLKEQQAVLGKTADAAARYRIEVAQGSDQERQQALALHDSIQAWHAAQIAIEQAAESARMASAVQRELSVFADGLTIDIAGLGLSDRARDLMQREHNIRQEFAQRRRALEEAQQVESTRLLQRQYDERLRLLQDAERQQIELLRRSAEEKQAVQGDWQLGARRAMQTYADDVSNLAQAMENAVSGAFKGMEDALVDFVSTGKMDFKGLADSIIKDMVRVTIQQSLMKPVMGWVGGMFSGAVVANAKGGVYDSPSLSRYSNQVHNRPQVFEFAKGAGIFAEAGPEAIMPLSRGQDGKLGVKADLSGAGTGEVHITVNVSDSGQHVSSTGAGNGWGMQIAHVVRKAVQEELARARRPGGQIWADRQGALA